jgi:hypothetical protein
MRSLKALVAFMGLLIVVGLGILAYGIYVKFGDMAEREAAGPGETWSGDALVSIPAGGRVEETLIGDGRLVVRVALPGGAQRLIVFDLATGARIGAIDLALEGAAQ